MEGFYTARQIKDRLSISTYVFWGHRPFGERALEELVRHGIVRIELLESPEQYDMSDQRSMKWVGEACRSCGVEIAAYHCFKTNFSDIDAEDQRKERVDRCRRQIDTMLELGGKLWGSHAQDADDVMVKSYEELARHIEGTEAVITVENTTRGPQIEDRVEFLDAMDHSQVGMILDIGHVRNADDLNPMTLPGGPTQILEQCGHRLRHIHLHGFKKGQDHHPPLVEGDEIQWVELFAKLQEIGYAGVLNFEPRGEPSHSNSVEYAGRAPERIVELAAIT